MMCPCGGMCREHEVIAGWVVTCNACGRRQTFPRFEAVPAKLDLFDETPAQRLGESQ